MGTPYGSKFAPTDTVLEGSTAYLTVDFLDKDGNLVVPTSVVYSIFCLSNGVAVKAETALGAASSIEIVIKPVDTVIINSANSRELKRVTVKAVYGLDDGKNAQFDYYVKNLTGV